MTINENQNRSIFKAIMSKNLHFCHRLMIVSSWISSSLARKRELRLVTLHVNQKRTPTAFLKSSAWQSETGRFPASQSITSKPRQSLAFSLVLLYGMWCWQVLTFKRDLGFSIPPPAFVFDGKLVMLIQVRFMRGQTALRNGDTDIWREIKKFQRNLTAYFCSSLHENVQRKINLLLSRGMY